MSVYIELDQSSAEQAQSIREQALKILRARKLSEQAVTDLDLIRITLPRALNNLGLDQPHYEKMVAAQYREENDLKPDQMTDEEILNNKIYSDDQRLSQVKTLELKTPDMKYPILMDFPDLQNLIQLMFYVQEDFLAEEWRLKDIRKYAEAMEDWCPMKILAMTYNGTLVTHFIQKWNSLGKEDLRIKCEAGWEAQQQFPDGYEMERAQLYQQLIMSAREKMFYEMILPPGVTNMDEDVESFIRIKAFYTTEGRPELAERAIEFMSEAPEWKGVQTWPEVEALTEKIKNVPLMRGFMNDPNEATKVATWGGIDIYVSTAQKSMFNEQTHVNTPYLAGYLSFKFSGTSTVIKRTENPLFDHVLTSNENNHNLTQIANAFEGLRNGIGAVAAEMKSLQNDLENTKAYVATNQGFSKSGELLQKRQRLNEIDKLLAESGATKVPEYDPSEKVTETVIEYDPNVYDPNFFNNAIKASKAKQNADEVQNENAEAQDVRSVTTGVKPSEMGAKFTEVKTDEAITAEPEDLKEHSEDLNSEQLKQQSAESVKDQSPLDLENSLRVAMGLKPKGQNEDTLNNNLPKRSVACEKALKQLKTNAEDLKDEVCYGRGL